MEFITETSSDRELRIAKSILEMARVTAGAAAAFVFSTVGKVRLSWVEAFRFPHLYVVVGFLLAITVLTYWMNLIEDNSESL
jgi:hypothetical protein